MYLFEIVKAENKNFWKHLASLWTYVTMFLFTLDFLSSNKYDAVASGVGIIYIAVLSIYAGSKEFQRWKRQKKFVPVFTGEIYIVAWTVLMLIFVIGAPLSRGYYYMPEEFITVYISILGIFAITRHSKIMHQLK